MMDVRFRPYTWVGERTPTAKKRRSPFQSSFRQTLAKLEDELRKLRATEIIIEAGFSEDDIRLDGWPRANAKPPAYPGVKISFNQPGVGRVEYPCDSCTHWQDNIHSIALGLEALRAVERYGITARMQQYTGFRAIDGPSNGIDLRTKQEAAAWITDQVTHRTPERRSSIYRTLLGLGVEEDLKKVLREAALKLHPDQNSGQDSLWRKFEQAKKLLDIG